MGMMMRLVIILSLLAQLIMNVAIQTYTENTHNGKMQMGERCAVANKV